jgi:L-alanine-DL-glutamate epimerase-like enolase superfamily enzyme
MRLRLTTTTERLPLRAPFRISRGVKTHAEVVVAELALGDAVGRGECVPYARYGETPASVAAQLAEAAARVAAGDDVAALIADLRAGAARNALDCAAWDLAARQSGRSVAERLGIGPPAAIETAVTVSLDTADAMAAAARAVADAPLIKVKLDTDGSAERLAAVANAAPGARLILDPNESWTMAELEEIRPLTARLPVVAVEQPLPAAEDAALERYAYPAPICADESVHTAADLPEVARRYGMVNIKLDKAGGLTEALAMLAAARALGLQVMAGCMVCSSLSIAPALFVGAGADLCDLDGPWWLADDRPGGARVEHGRIHPPARGFWGER